MLAENESSDEEYFQVLAGALRRCALYKPKFGQGGRSGMTLEQFQQVYGSDPFYSWVGLDSPLMYAAHKAAGGMTSIYRQLGMGSQWVFAKILQDKLGLSAADSMWVYQVPVPGKQPRSLSLDGRIEFDHVRDANAIARIRQWVKDGADKLLLPEESRQQLKGVVFEVRQGYKSKDSKRQNADIANASNAYANLYMPVLLLLSTQLDLDLAARYVQARWLLLIGSIGGRATDSTYTFCRDILNYDLAGFFQRNSSRIKEEVEKVLIALLQP